jgi:hypothetical protein
MHFDVGISVMGEKTISPTGIAIALDRNIKAHSQYRVVLSLEREMMPIC